MGVPSSLWTEGDTVNREPTAIITAVGVFLSALTKAAVLLGFVDWDVEQLAGISLVIDSGLVVIGALLIRERVTPTASPRLDIGTEVNGGTATVETK
jgi:hypothetical protein